MDSCFDLDALLGSGTYEVMFRDCVFYEIQKKYLIQ